MFETIKATAILGWRQFNYQLILVGGTFASLLVEALLAPEWSPLRIVPLALVALCLTYFCWSSITLLRSVHPRPQIAYFLCTGKPADFLENAVRQQGALLRSRKLQWPAVQRLFRIHRSDWVFSAPGLLSDKQEDWLRLVRGLLRHFWALPKRVEGVPDYHLFFVVPPTVAFAFGAYVGRKFPHVAYHYIGNVGNPYIAVADTTNRGALEGLEALNRRIPHDQFDHLEVEETRQKKDGTTIIAMDFTNHMVPRPYPGEADAREIIRVGHKNGIGHLPEGDWERLGRELASLILSYSDTRSAIDLYVNAPITLAFIIGSLVGPASRVMLCEYNRYQQRPLRCFRLADPQLHQPEYELMEPLADSSTASNKALQTDRARRGG